MSYRDVRVRAAHAELGKRHPVWTIIGPGRATLLVLGLAVLGLAVWVVQSAGWVTVGLWSIVVAGPVLIVARIAWWWTGH